MTQFILNKFAGLKSETLLINELAIFQGFSDSLKTPVSSKLVAASTFDYHSAEYKKIKIITWILLALI